MCIERRAVREVLGDTPDQRIMCRLHLERKAARLRTRQFCMLRQVFFDQRGLFRTCAHELPGQPHTHYATCSGVISVTLFRNARRSSLSS